MPDLPLGTHALCGLLRYSGPDVDPARFAGVLRAALRDSPGRLARDGYVSIRCEAQPAPFVQTWRKHHDVLADEWAMVVQVLVDVREHPVPEAGIKDLLLRTARSFGADIDAAGVRVERAPVGDVARAAEAAPFSPRSYPAPYEPWRSTPALGQPGHSPLPGCAVAPSVRLPRQPGGAAPAPPRPPQATQPTPPGPAPTPAPTEAPPYYPPPPAPNLPAPTGAPPPPPRGGFNWRILGAGVAAVGVFVAAAVGVSAITGPDD